MQVISRAWIVVDGTRIAVDCIAAFVGGETRTTVYLKGGHTLDLAISGLEFQRRVRDSA